MLMTAVKRFWDRWGGSPGKADSLPEKHIRYYKILDAFGGEECPVCRLLEEAEAQYVHTLLLERVNDRALRKRFNQDGGFCRRHTRGLLGRHDGLAMVILNRKLLEEEIRRLESPAGGAAASVPGKGRCEICDYLTGHEDRYVQNIKSYLGDEGMKQKILSSRGFCVPHLRMMEEAEPRGLPPWFREFQADAYRNLQDRCDRYRQSENCTLGEDRPVLTREESLIWRRMVKVLYGLFSK